MTYIPPCPQNWETCETCGARPEEGCLDPDVATRVQEETMGYKAAFIETQDSTEAVLELPTSKDTNPKDAVGILKVAMSTVSAPVLAEVGVAMLEGARKYGRHNYRVSGVRASVYYDAAMRHLLQWWEGEDTDPDSGMSHVTKAITSLVVLRDAMVNDMVTDDRPPKAPSGWLRELNAVVEDLFEKYPDAAPAHTAVD